MTWIGIRELWASLRYSSGSGMTKLLVPTCAIPVTSRVSIASGFVGELRMIVSTLAACTGVSISILSKPRSSPANSGRMV